MSRVAKNQPQQPAETTTIFDQQTLDLIKSKLSECFDPEDIKWLPGTTNKDRTSAQAMAYADPRAYMDRLNEVVGPENWSKEFRTLTATGFDRVKEGWGNAEDKVFPNQGKLLVTCRLTIKGIGATEDVGEAELTDPNAHTVAAAQAFKRACVQFGMGRYLYDLPKVWCDFDNKTKQFKTTPVLPDWAIPTYHCSETGKKLEATEVNGKVYSVQDLVRISRHKYGRILSVEGMTALAKQAKERAGNKTEDQAA